MSQESNLQHIDQYLCLPELQIPAVAGDERRGWVYPVLSIDFCIAFISDCQERGIEAMEIPLIHRCALPMIVVEEDKEAVYYRLPHSLTPWVYELMRDRGYESQFPAMVELGVRRDEHYARFVESPAR